MSVHGIHTNHHPVPSLSESAPKKYQTLVSEPNENQRIFLNSKNVVVMVVRALHANEQDKKFQPIVNHNERKK